MPQTTYIKVDQRRVPRHERVHLDGKVAPVIFEGVLLPNLGPVAVVRLAVLDAVPDVEGSEALRADVEAVVDKDLVSARLHGQMGRSKEGVPRQELLLDLRAPDLPAALAALLPRDEAVLAEPLVPQ